MTVFVSLYKFIMNSFTYYFPGVLNNKCSALSAIFSPLFGHSVDLFSMFYCVLFPGRSRFMCGTFSQSLKCTSLAIFHLFMYTVTMNSFCILLISLANQPNIICTMICQHSKWLCISGSSKVCNLRYSKIFIQK